MEDLLITTIFVLAIAAPMAIAEHIKQSRENKKPAVMRRHYDTVYNWFYNQYAQRYGNELPDFMNRRIISSAHAKAVEIAQSGKLYKVYMQIKRYKQCI
ncbi:MAG: hypothetical protein NC408_04665 [Candidatus Gastranaerophilales bacterium]|nr:hypothetical protein [Candidatus Gastranaerophilales bacterium]MCM1072236.1 hypothetical protein [Bacteroides sp.]